MKRTFLLLLIILLLSGGGYVGFKKKQGPPKELEVHFVDVGQGNAVLIRTKSGVNMLIDAGSNQSSDKLLEYIQLQGIHRLDHVIATHPDEDHIGGMAKIIRNFSIDNFYMPNKTHNTSSFEQMISQLKRKKISVYEVHAKDVIPLDEEVKFLVLNPDDRVYTDNNGYSIAGKLTNGKNSFLFTGDIGAINEYYMISVFGKELKSDVLMFSHHGSSGSNSPDFVQSVAPIAAIASAGNNNRFGHPHKEVRLMLNSLNIPLYRTDQQGTIIFYSDGDNISVDMSNPGNYD